ncbi:MAG: ATP-binding protein [Candidatus Sedimenticola sp. (ex Thyasira tokunagai)]
MALFESSGPIDTQVILPDEERPERALFYFFVYRLALAVTLALLFFTNTGPSLLGSHSGELFALTASIYVGMVIAGGLLLYAPSPMSPQNQGILMVFIDICSITLLTHASGGVESGLGMLMAVSIAFGSLICRGLSAGLLAALASLFILTEQVYSHLSNSFINTAYTQSGLLGVLFFAIATLSHVLSLQLRRSEALASQRELDLANLEQLNEYVIQHMQTGIIVADSDNSIRLMNEAAWYLVGMPSAGTDDSLEEVSHELLLQLEQWRADHQFQIVPFRPTPAGRELKAGFSRLGTRGDEGTVIFLEDMATVTQQAQQMKLASLGRLTASIAHEIRNPLGAIGHAEQLLRESPDLPQSDQRLIDIINTNTLRVNEVIENILQFSRRSRSQPEEFILKHWLQQFVSDLQRSHRLTDETIQLQIEPDSTLIRADPSQLRQMFVILCENAINHFDREQHLLSIKINGGITRESGGPFVDIIDNGPGIDAETVRQIFEPFFTTRNSGTGLGLFIAKELSESNRLGLDYITIPTGGSCFRITFPGRGNQPIES